MTSAARVGTWSLRARLATLVGVVGALLIGASVAVGLALEAVGDAQHALVNRIDPADLNGIDLYAQLINQETGIRGYALNYDKSYLQPYTSGLVAEKADLARLRGYCAGQPVLLAQVEALEDAAQQWRADYAIPVLQRGEAAREDIAQVGKERFDAIRARYTALHGNLANARADQRDRLNNAENVLFVAAGCAVAVLLIAAGILWFSLRRWVIRPLTQLGADARQVASGDLAHRMRVEGPHETAEVASDVETMRLRLVGDLDELAAIQRQLERQAVELERRAADLLRSNTDLEQFAYVASHDLQEPLRKVASFTQLLQERYSGQLDERADTYIGFAVDGAKRMQRLIEDLLAFSRVGRTRTNFTDVDLDQALDDVRETLSVTIENAGAQVISRGLPTVPGDATLLTQLLLNLTGNAIKFRSPDRPAIVEFGGRLVGGEWHLWCRDNGIGIDPKYAEKVFVIFQRLHGRDEYAGTGIGLALCKKIVEFHGGRIRITPDLPPDSTVSGDTGTTVEWTLPAGALPGETGDPAAVTLHAAG